MRTILLPMMVLLFAKGGASPIVSMYDTCDSSSLASDSYLADSTRQSGSDSLQPKPRLLPGNISIMERGLWGEFGILRSMGIAGPLTPEVRKNELSLRRGMLTAHQIGGFATFGLMVASCYTGQRVLDGHKDVSDAHSSLVKITIGTYTATALLSILSPPPLIRRDDQSTTSIHKTLAWIHVAGMILTPIIGGLVWKFHRQDGTPVLQQSNSAARFHQVSAYITTGVFAAALVVMTF